MWRPLLHWSAFGSLALLLAGCAGGYGSRSAVNENQLQPFVVPLSRTSYSTELSPPTAAPSVPSNGTVRRIGNSSPEAVVRSGDSNGALLAVAASGRGPAEGDEKKDGKYGKDNGKDSEKNGNENGKEGGDKAKPPGPRTLPEALCEYIRVLHARPWLNGPEDKAKDDKSGNGAPDSKEKENGKDDEKDKKEEPKDEWLSAHFQLTYDMQHHPAIKSPYSSPFSLFPFSETRASETATIFLDARLWESGNYSGELIVNPETSGGKGFSGVNGMAGFPNGDITRVGVVEPTLYFARLFLRQTWGLGGEQEQVDDGQNQIAGKRDIDRFTLSVGKFAITDVIDNNTYSHDPRSQLQNWSMMYNGAWDYPANVRGYGYGLSMEYNQKNWALRYAVMSEPSFSNGAPLDPHFIKANGHALEWEGRWTVDEHPGKVRLMAYLNHARMGDYREALIEMPVNPDVTATRSYRYKYGCGLNVEQEITRDLGFWGRLGWSDGNTESWAFTPIDRTAALGLLLKGRSWARPNDEAGIGAAWNGIAKAHRDYLRAGGHDFSIGDGQLNYGLEKILEVYYRFAVIKGIYVNADFQELWNPAYNRDRGPVSIVSMMLHLEY